MLLDVDHGALRNSRFHGTAASLVKLVSDRDCRRMNLVALQAMYQPRDGDRRHDHQDREGQHQFKQREPASQGLSPGTTGNVDFDQQKTSQCWQMSLVVRQF